LATEKKSFLLRIDPEVWVGLERLAASELRSVNSQVEFLLRESLAKRGVNVARQKKKNKLSDEK